MGIVLDPKTFMFCMGIFGLLMSVISFIYAKTFPSSIQGLFEWGIAMLLVAISFFGYMLRGVLDGGFITHVVANTCVLFGAAYIVIAYAKLFKKSQEHKKVVIFALIFWVLFLLDYYRVGETISSTRVAVVTLPCALLLAWAAHLSFRTMVRNLRISSLISILSNLTLFFVLMYRVYNSIFGNLESSQLHANSSAQIIFFSASSITIVLSSVGFILLATEKLAEESIEQTAQAQYTSRLTALGEMAGGIAHEINNPLAIIQGGLERLHKTLPEYMIKEQQTGKLLHMITRNVERISKIIRGLRVLTKESEQDPFTLERLDMIVHDTLDLCTERFQSEGIALNVEVDTDVQINCRPIQISQILINLLNNAHDAIILSKDSFKQVTIKGYLDSEWVFLKVTNSGSPIPVEIREKMFQPFFTTKEIGKGIGLGLSISKKMAEQHFGLLYLDSKVEQTTFVLKLPNAGT